MGSPDRLLCRGRCSAHCVSVRRIHLGTENLKEIEVNELKQTLFRGLNVGVYYAGLVAPLAAVAVVATWLTGGGKK